MGEEVTPKVSIIIPTYNRAQVLGRAIDSVYGQSYKDFEVIAINDGSTDQTAEVLKKWCHAGVKIINQENLGVSAARNSGIKVAKGEWLAFLDSDDEWLPEKLKRQMDFIKSNESFLIIHTDEIWIRNGVRVNAMNKHKKSGGDLYKNSLKLCCISPSTVLLHKNIFKQYGFFREDYPVCEDYDLWLKITAKEKVAFIEEPLIIKYGGNEDQLSRKYKAMDYWRILSMQDRFNSRDLNEEQKNETIKELKFKCSLLLKGYRKHQNLNRYDRIYKILLENSSHEIRMS